MNSKTASIATSEAFQYLVFFLKPQYLNCKGMPTFECLPLASLENKLVDISALITSSDVNALIKKNLEVKAQIK